MSAKQRATAVLPTSAVERLDQLAHSGRRARLAAIRKTFGALGFNVARKADYYSPLPVLEDIAATRGRWDRPSALAGLKIDVDAMAVRLFDMADRWEDDFQANAGDYTANQQAGFGPGYPPFDARTLYYVLRDQKPANYLEVGSGLSTYYATLAAKQNAEDGRPMQISCIEPYPFDALKGLPGIDLMTAFVQDVPVERFEALDAGDLFFIDSSHALKVDSDVAYLFLEVLPRIQPGVIVHIHDVPFPYNTPFPADYWMFGERWPIYWNEAMVVQTFLAFNDSFEIELSTPLLRHHDEARLAERFADYVPVRDDLNPPSSLWLRRVR